MQQRSTEKESLDITHMKSNPNGLRSFFFLLLFETYFNQFDKLKKELNFSCKI